MFCRAFFSKCIGSMLFCRPTWSAYFDFSCEDVEVSLSLFMHTAAWDVLSYIKNTRKLVFNISNKNQK